jgi:molybdate transport system substrate-binding protein
MLMSGGAAQSLVTGMQPAFEESNHCAIEAEFDAVGTLRDKLVAGKPCDLMILSSAVVQELERAGWLARGSGRSLGSVATSLAVPAGAELTAITTEQELKAALAATSGFYVPSLHKSSGGLHVYAVLSRLGMVEALADRIHEYRNGAAAMLAMARAGDMRAIGCTQRTEILREPGVSLVGDLPAGYDLNTEYVAAICANAQLPELAERFVDMLSSDSAREARSCKGFRI